MITISRYTGQQRIAWNEFLQKSRTNSFLFSRDFMEYHKDRFEDHSLMIFDDGKLVGIFPASIKGGVLNSHGGLTFGGLVVGRNEYAKNTLLYLGSLLKYCHDIGFSQVLYKQSPVFYSDITQDETDYGLFLARAKLYRVDIAFAIDQQAPEKVPYQERRRRAIKKAIKSGVEIKESNDFSTFWNQILIPNLFARFGVPPVHSLDEINSLAIANKGHIRQFEAWSDNQIMAGCTIFETPNVAHAQYISASDTGRQNGAIDFLFHHLITEIFKQKKYFDFGIVNEQEGYAINSGLLDWKEGFGARAYAHRFYEIDPSQYIMIDRAIKPIAENL